MKWTVLRLRILKILLFEVGRYLHIGIFLLFPYCLHLKRKAFRINLTRNILLTQIDLNLRVLVEVKKPRPMKKQTNDLTNYPYQ